MKIDSRIPIAKIAVEVPGAVAVFESLGIDYACAGNLSLDDAAHAEGIAPAVVISCLQHLKAVDHTESWSDRPLADLVRHLVAQHHRFVREELAAIALRLADLCTAPASANPDLLSLRAAFTRLSDIVLPHIHHEEENVFPAVEALEKKWESGEPLGAVEDGLTANLRQLANEHGAIAGELRKMRELRIHLAESNELPAPCSSILDDIATLESHFHEYMFLENCVLFPRAEALETQASTPAANRKA
jgi:regulator of cell morphogenesis and NO signaling